MTGNDQEQIQGLIRRIERLLDQYPHLIQWVAEIIDNAENQRWRQS